MAGQTFRSAFNGFNREDVINHLEYVNSKHTTEMNQLKLELEFLRTENEQLQNQPSAGEAEAIAEESVSALEAENAALREEIEALKAQLAEAKSQPKEVTAAAPVNELELYRRAERVEREARARAEQVCHQVNGALADATAKVDEAAAQIDQVADRVSGQLADLQSLVAGSKQVLREALSSIGTIQPGK